MASISCPKCAREVADSAAFCPYCGTALQAQTVKPTVTAAPETDIPQDSGPVVSEQAEIQTTPLTDTNVPAAPTDPVPSATEHTPVEATPAYDDNSPAVPENTVSENAVQPKKTRSTKTRLLIIGGVVILVVAAVIIALVLTGRHKAEKAREEYIDNLQLAQYTMLLGAADAESICNLTRSVWYNTIFEESDPETDPYTKSGYLFNEDFNTSLIALYADPETQEAIAELESNQELVGTLMVSLTEPPEEFEHCYSIVQEMYDAYISLTNLAITPSGSLTTYSEDFGTLDSTFIQLYDELSLYLPEE
jgi:hypothetical protein